MAGYHYPTPRKDWCSREDSNLHGFPHPPLKRTRLPFRHGCKYWCPLKESDPRLLGVGQASCHWTKRAWCGREESNLHGCLAHRLLRPARMPVPPRPHECFWWARRELHPHTFRHRLLRPACLLFHHEPLVAPRGIEPPRLSAPGFEAGASAVPPRSDEYWCLGRELHSHPPGKNRVFCC